MIPGDHIFVVRPFGYSHHGIYVGNDMVIHLAGTGPASKSLCRVQHVSVAKFASGDGIQVQTYEPLVKVQPPGRVVEAAWARCGETGYNLFTRNCEHFARWCRTGTSRSLQVENGARYAGPIAAPVVAKIALGLATAAGAAKVASGPGLMSALKDVGGDTISGLQMLALAPTPLTVAATCHAYRDDPSESDLERHARKNARVCAVVGAAVAWLLIGSLVAHCGKVKGLSGAGLSSGLKAMGGPIGGGMNSGAILAISIPAFASIGSAFLGYRLSR